MLRVLFGPGLPLDYRHSRPLRRYRSHVRRGGINALFGVLQEGKAERALDAIRGMISPEASVQRDGRRISIDTAEVVPGDVLLLEAGDRIAADVRSSRRAASDRRVGADRRSGARSTRKPVADAALIGDRHSMALWGTLRTRDGCWRGCRNRPEIRDRPHQRAP